MFLVKNFNERTFMKTLDKNKSFYWNEVKKEL